MDLPLELNKNQQVAKIVIAGEKDFGFLAGWREKLGKDQNPFRVDSVAFAQLVMDRFSVHSAIQPYVTSADDIGDHIKSNPHSEVAGVALLTCDWFPDSPVLGLCHFRRTWCNNVILDYLASHPFIAKRPDGYLHHVKGVGLALLYFLSRLAERYGCEYIWGEATQLSCDYYKKVLSLDSVKDLILIPRDKFVEFAKQLDSVWQGKSRAMTRENLTVQEVYQLEEEKPPMVGNRSAVFSPPRRVPIVRQQTPGSRRSFDLVRWGLIPSWAKDPSIATKTINAMSETAADKPAFRDALRLRRCLIPADSFYEWQPIGPKHKQPFSIGMADDTVFAFAGLWESWEGAKGDVVETCTILTTTPNALVADVHRRMPAILKRDDYERWLDPSIKSPSALSGCLEPFNAALMKRYPVSSRVNRPENDDRECAQEVTVSGTPTLF